VGSILKGKKRKKQVEKSEEFKRGEFWGLIFLHKKINSSNLD
jgi:hypothetical protein